MAMKLFKRKEKPLEVEIVEQGIMRKQELATVQVRDIKEYLLDEYERSQKLFEQNERLKGQMLKAEEIKIKYDATLVTLDEYKTRLESYDRRFLEQEEKCNQAKEETRIVRDELNDYKIKFQRASITKEEIKAEIEREVKNDIIDRIMKHKGNLSKKTAVDIVKNNDIGKQV